MKLVLNEDQLIFDALGKLSPESSKTTLRSWLKEGRVSVNGEVVKTPTFTVCKGQEVSLGVKPRFTKCGLRIYYEDRHIVVIEKPSGLLSVATAFELGDTAHARLKNHYRPNRVYVVHRLDQDTSGVMMFALSEQARDQLKLTFEKHEIERAYTAFVEGFPDPSTGTWRSFLYEDEQYVVHSFAEPLEVTKEAITHYDVIETSKRYALLHLKLETGRKNQIRVHCRDAGVPIAGDKKYGATTDPIRQLCLHAHLLAFQHPITKRLMRFDSPLPEAFRKIIRGNNKCT